MKNIIVKSVCLFLLLLGMGVIAQTKIVTIKETPVRLTQDGTVYVVPEGSTATYYTYTMDQKEYVCTATAPAELVDVNGVNLSVRMGTSTRDIKCYPSTYFTVAP